MAKRATGPEVVRRHGVKEAGVVRRADFARSGRVGPPKAERSPSPATRAEEEGDAAEGEPLGNMAARSRGRGVASKSAGIGFTDFGLGRQSAQTAPYNAEEPPDEARSRPGQTRPGRL